MEKIQQKLTKKFIKEIIEILTKSKDENQIKILFDTTTNEFINEIEEFKNEISSLILERELVKFQEKSYNQFILLIKILNLTLFKNNFKEIENFLFAIFHVKNNIYSIKIIQEKLKILNTIVNEITYENFRDLTKREIFFSNFFLYNKNDLSSMDIEENSQNNLNNNYSILLDDIFYLISYIGFNSKFINRTCSQLLKYLISSLTIKQKSYSYDNNNPNQSVFIEFSETFNLIKKHNNLVLCFLFYNPYFDHAFSLIDFVIDFLNKIYLNKIDSSIKNSSGLNGLITENKDNYNSNYLLFFVKKENIYKILNIKNFQFFNLSEFMLSHEELLIERNLCLFHFIQSYKGFYINLRERYFSNPDNLIFDCIKNIEIYQEIQDAFFFIPNMYFYTIKLLKNKKINTANINKLENHLVGKISKISRLESKFSSNLLKFQKINSLQYKPLNTHDIYISNIGCRVSYEIFSFAHNLKIRLINNFKYLIKNNFFWQVSKGNNLNTDLIANNKSYQTEYNNSDMKYDIWMDYYLENPYLTFLVTYKFFYEFFINEKVDFEDEIQNFGILGNWEDKYSDIFNFLYFPFNTNKGEFFNYFDIYENEKLLHRITEKMKNKEVLLDYLRINLKMIFTQYVMFDNDMLNYSFVLKDVYSTEEIKDNIITYKCELMNLIWKIKVYFDKISNNYFAIKSDIDRIFSDVIKNQEQALHYKMITKFDKNLTQFIIEKIEPSFVCIDYIDEMVYHQNVEIRLNGIYLLGYIANVYPTQIIYDKTLQIIENLKNFDQLKIFFKTINNIISLLESIFLLSKAFPKKNEYIMNFLNYSKHKLENLIDDYDLLSESKLMIDKSMLFIENFIIDSDYINSNNMLIGLK